MGMGMGMGTGTGRGEPAAEHVVVVVQHLGMELVVVALAFPVLPTSYILIPWGYSLWGYRGQTQQTYTFGGTIAFLQPHM